MDTKFKLRPWTEADLENLVLYANNIAIAKNMTNQFPHPYTEANGKTFIEFASQHEPRHILCIDIDGKACGGIGIHPQADIHCKNAELGYWLAEPFWGRGIISQAVKQMVQYGFDNFDITRIFARPFGTNLASQRVLEKAGFTLEARFKNALFKQGEYIDELIYVIYRPA